MVGYNQYLVEYLDTVDITTAATTFVDYMDVVELMVDYMEELSILAMRNWDTSIGTYTLVTQTSGTYTPSRPISHW